MARRHDRPVTGRARSYPALLVMLADRHWMVAALEDEEALYDDEGASAFNDAEGTLGRCDTEVDADDAAQAEFGRRFYDQFTERAGFNADLVERLS